MARSPILNYQPGGGVSSGGAPLPIEDITGTGTTQLIDGQAYIDVAFGTIQTDAEWVFVECLVVNTTDPTPLNIWPGIITGKTVYGFQLQLNGLPDSDNYYLHWSISGTNIEPGPASTYSLTGPTTGALGEDSTFTVALLPSTTLDDPVIVTPDDGGAGGTFSPTSVTLSDGAPSVTFDYSPVLYGVVTISTINDGTLINPSSLTFTPVADTYTLSGPSGGADGVESTDFTVALPVGSTVIGTVIVTPSSGGGGGTLTPTTVALTTAAPSATFTYTPTTTGTKTIAVTNDGGLTNPASLNYVVLFDPSTIFGCRVWLKADALALSDGAAVASWTDSSGSGNDFAQATGGLQPIYKTAIVNAQPVVRFDGSDDVLQSTAVLLTGLATSYTIIAAIKPSSTAVGAIFATGTASVPCIQFAHDTTQWFYQHNNGAGPQYATDSGFTSGNWAILSGDWDSANIRLYRNGVLKATTAVVAIGSTGTVNSVGKDAPSNLYPWTGDIAEVLFYRPAITSTDRENVEGYLAAKYAIS